MAVNNQDLVQAPTAHLGEKKDSLAATVLLVDDEDSVRALLTRYLSLSGYRVLTAGDTQSALALWDAHHDEIRLLLTDVVMPNGLGGRELAAQLQVQKPSLAVIYTSGYNVEWADETDPYGREVHFLQKPYYPTQLLGMVRDALSAPVPGQDVC
jgi:two-component system cell cycle sensor histidine kinase/response regulator CckA